MILKEAGMPLDAYEITRRALSRKLIRTRGKTPYNTMHTTLYRDIMKKGEKSAFVRKTGRVFALNPTFSE